MPERILSGITAVVWGGVGSYFVYRYLLHRRIVSLGIAAMACGWVLFGFSGHLGHIDPYPWGYSFALLLGAFVWYAILRVEFTGR